MDKKTDLNAAEIIADLVEQDRQLVEQARTQVMANEEQGSASGADAVQTPRSYCRNTVTEKAIDPATFSYSNLSTTGSRRLPDPAQRKSRHDRLKHMEGPAESPDALAEKLAYFTYYELLYVDDDATTEAIHAAYVKRVSDIRSRFQTGVLTQEWRLTEFIKILHEAHTVLTNAKLRTEYDSRLKAGSCKADFKNLVGETPDFYKDANLLGGSATEVTVKDLLLCAGYVSALELTQQCADLEGPELAEKATESGLITFEEMAATLLGKALVDRRLLTVAQFVQAVSEMRRHSTRFIDAIVGEGWLTQTEMQMLGLY